MFEEDWFEKTRKYREEVLYPQLFGPAPPEGAHPLGAEVFVDVFGQRSFDPRWLHTGVLEYRPFPGREGWLYVSSGLSDDWWSDEPDAAATSGIGCEFVLELADRAAWAIASLLQVCAMQILLAHGRFEGRRALGPHDLLPLQLPLGAPPSALSHLLVIPSPGLPEASRLRSGSFRWYHLLGITYQEAVFGRRANHEALLKHLAVRGRARVTDPSRESTV